MYNNCALATEVTPVNGGTICWYKSFGFEFDGEYASLWKPLIAKYGLTTIEAYIENNFTDTAAGDTMERKDQKTSLGYHEYTRGAAITKLQDPNS